MAVLKIRSGGVWRPVIDPGPTGPQGPMGPAGQPGQRGARGPDGDIIPTGGLPGEFLVKTSDADREVGWRPPTQPYATLQEDWLNNGALNASCPGPVSANGWIYLFQRKRLFDPTRLYQVTASLRCISDAGGDCSGEVVVWQSTSTTSPGSQIIDHYFTASGAGVGLWGSVCCQVLARGDSIATIGAPDWVTGYLAIKLSVANLTVYLPRLTYLDVGPAV